MLINKINFLFIFIFLNFFQAHLDAMDVAGDNQLNVEHEMIKQRLTKDGKPIGKAGIEIIGEVYTTSAYHLYEE